MPIPQASDTEQEGTSGSSDNESAEEAHRRRSFTPYGLRMPRLWDKNLKRRQPLSAWYSFRSIASMFQGIDGRQELIDYESTLLVSVRVFCVKTGTVLKKTIFWTETGIVMLVFGCSSAVTVLLSRCGLLGYTDIQKQAGSVASFCALLTTVIVFLMGFFTSLNFNRWWTLWTEGVSEIWSTSGQLTMAISTFVTNDEQVISAVDRYARASLMMLFMAHREDAVGRVRVLVKRDILTSDEADMLEPLKSLSFASISIWTWIAAIINGLKYQQNLIKSEQILRYLIDHVQTGQHAAQAVVSQMSAPVPMSYVALIGWIVKFHNFGYAILYGCLGTSDLVLDVGKTTYTTTIARVLIISAVFNCMLILNQELMNPWDGTSMDADFPMSWLNSTIKRDLSNYPVMARRLPKWFAEAGLNYGPCNMQQDHQTS